MKYLLIPLLFLATTLRGQVLYVPSSATNTDSVKVGVNVNNTARNAYMIDLGRKYQSRAKAYTDSVALANLAKSNPGPQGPVGNTGAAGRGITSTAVNNTGHLIINYSDASSSDAGYVIGAAGSNGTNGISPSLSVGSVNEGAAAVSITGTQVNPVLNFTLQKGNTGNTGANGTNGVSPALSIGLVSTGSPAAATLTGTTANPVLNFTIPPGAAGSSGTNGVSPVLSIGTVQTGSPAAATITGSQPSPVLNLTIPQGAVGSVGQTGQTGATPNITVGAVTQVAAGGSPSATITGTTTNPVLNLALVAGNTGAQGGIGNTGATGATPNITIGAVSNVAAGSPATASVTGTTPNLTLNLGLPVGATGATGPAGTPAVIPTPSIATRAFNTPYVISATKQAFVCYSVTIAAAISLTAGQTGSVSLQTSANGTTFTSQGIVSNGNTGTLTVGLNLTDTNGIQLCGFVPAGYTVKLVTTGNAVITMVTGTETF